MQYIFTFLEAVDAYFMILAWVYASFKENHFFIAHAKHSIFGILTYKKLVIAIYFVTNVSICLIPMHL